MTAAPETTPAVVDNTVGVTIDGFELRVPKGTLIIRAAEEIGVQIPRFCDHPLLDPIGACRQCIVEVEGQRKPVASCTTTVADGMVVKTQLSSPVAEKAQRGTLELLLINHPLDCPICDKGGECPLQNQAMSNGQADSRFRDVKRTYPKPLAISTQVLLDRERCVLCARCTRFSQQVAGDPFIELFERGALEQVAIDPDTPFQSYFSGNTVQICPVGALTSAAYRFRARPFDLQSTPSVCEHCASGCSLRVDWRRGKIQRRLAADDPAVNDEWNCDKGRFAFTYAQAADRIMKPQVRSAETGELVEVSWPEAFEAAAAGLRAARDANGVGVLAGGRVTLEDAYAYSKFARVVLGTNDVDFRARAHSAEEADFLGARIAGRTGATYADLDTAASVLLVGFEPEEESPIVFLRLRKNVRKRGLGVAAIAPFRTNGLRKLSGELIATAPGREADALAGELPFTPEVILVGERLAGVPGGLNAAVALADRTGATLGWVPRRAGERGAVEAGLLPGLLPGGRRVSDAEARVRIGQAWGATVPTTPGRDTAEILLAAAEGNLSGLLVGGVDTGDLPDPELAERALAAAGFVVSLELRPSPVTARADVVLPVAPQAEKSGTFLTWEGRARPFDTTINSTGALPDGRILNTLADELDVHLGLPDAAHALREVLDLGSDPDVEAPQATGSPVTQQAPEPGAGQAVLATWRQLLDLGTLQDGEPHLAGTAKPPVARVSAATAIAAGVGPGEPLTVSTDRGSITLPLAVEEMPDHVVWLPANSPGSEVHRQLAATAGSIVTLSGGAR